MNNDFSDILEEPKGESNALVQVKKTAEEQEQAEVRVEKAEAELDLAKRELRRISEVVFPELLNSLELTDCTVADLRVQLAEKLRGSIPKAHEVEAIDWLNKHGHGNIVKRQIIIEFSKDEEKWAAKFMRDCNQRKKKLNMKVKRTVHPMTLQSWAKEMLEKAENFPMDIFGIFLQRFTKITRAEKEDKPF